MSLHRIVSCCLLILSSCCQLLAAESPLVWKFKVGDQHQYRMTQDMDMEMTIGATDRKMETGVQQVLDLTWKIEQVDDQGQAKVVQKVNRLQMDMQAPGQQTVHYDTDSDKAPTGFGAMLVPLLKALTAEPSTMTMTPRGKIKDLEVPEALAKSMQAIPGAAMMGEMFSDEGFKNMIQQSSLVLPESQDLERGHEWTTKSQMNNPQFGVLDIETTYRYLGPREVKNEPYESFSIKMKMEFGETPGGVEIDVFSHESHGEVLFSREAGRLESSKMQQDLTMNITAADQQVIQRMVQTVIFERVAKQQAK